DDFAVTLCCKRSDASRRERALKLVIHTSIFVQSGDTIARNSLNQCERSADNEFRTLKGGAHDRTIGSAYRIFKVNVHQSILIEGCDTLAADRIHLVESPTDYSGTVGSQRNRSYLSIRSG